MNLLSASVAAVCSIEFWIVARAKVSSMYCTSVLCAYLVDLGLRDDRRGHGSEHREETLRPEHELLLLGGRDHVADIVLDRSRDLVELVVAGLLAALCLLILGLAPLQVPLDELEVHELLDRAVTGDENQLREVERVAEGRRGVVVLGRFCGTRLARFGARIHGGVSVVVRLVRRLRDLRLRLFGLGLLSEHADGHLAQHLRAEGVRLVAECVDSVDRLLRHAEPFLARRRSLDRLGESSEDGTVHRQSDLDVA